MRSHPAVLIIAVLLTAGGSEAAPVARDPIEGRWLGTAGAERERIEIGLEFKRDADGKLNMRLTQPISNYFDVDAGGEVERNGDRLEIDALALSMKLSGDRLEGTFPGPNSPAQLRRVEELPQELAPPQVSTGPGPRWQTRLGGQVYASPVIADGVAYVGTTGGVMNAVNVADGSMKWTHSTGAPIFGDVAATTDAIYFVADHGFLVKLDRADGKLVWRYDLGDRTSTRVLPHPTVYDWDWHAPKPLVTTDSVFVGAGDGSFHAVKPGDGSRRWRFHSNGKIRNGAASDGTQVFFGSADHHVYALDATSGKENWRTDTGGEVDATPVVHAGRVLTGNRAAALHALDAKTGKSDWRLYFWGSWVESTPVVVDNVIYIGSSDLRRVSAVNPANGHVLWRTDVHGWTWGTPLVIGDRIYAGAAGGTPYFVKHVASFNTLDRKTGKILQRWPLPDTGGHQWGIAGSPVLAGDSVIVASIEGSLLSFPR